jgi:hypothetical protein
MAFDHVVCSHLLLLVLLGPTTVPMKPIQPHPHTLVSGCWPGMEHPSNEENMAAMSMTV